MNRSARTSAVVAVSLMLAILASASCSRRTQTAPSYLFLWAGDADGKASDFLGVIDAAPASPRYGSIVASIPTRTPGTHPHHTELEMPAPLAQPHLKAEMIAAARSVKKISPMFAVRDMRATVRWYQSIGFTLQDEYEDCGELVFARLTFGSGEFTLGPGGNPGPRDVSLWFFTDRVQELYDVLKERQFRAAGGASNGAAGEFEVRFEEDLYSPFYGGRQFSIRDINGLALIFWQPEWLSSTTNSITQS